VSPSAPGVGLAAEGSSGLGCAANHEVACNGACVVIADLDTDLAVGRLTKSPGAAETPTSYPLTWHEPRRSWR
jgi:hypothetical protein